jgi:hypothetical protein
MNTPETRSGGSLKPVGSERSCWFTDDSDLHPETGCPSADDWLTVATNGRERWINCSQCNGTWMLPNTELRHGGDNSKA